MEQIQDGSFGNFSSKLKKFENSLKLPGVVFSISLIILENAKYDDTKSMYEYNAGWFRPYATFEKVGLKNGPRVENTAYGSFFGFTGFFQTYLTNGGRNGVGLQAGLRWAIGKDNSK